MSDECGTCATYLEAIAQLRAEISRLNRENNRLRDRLGMLRGDVAQVVKVIDNEVEKPTMPKGKLLDATQQRLVDALEASR
jgi:regulator of replication initiation timing